MPDPISIAVITTFIAASTPSWLETLRGVLFDKGRETLLDKGKEFATEKGSGLMRRLLHLDEKEQQRHLELALKNAVERGLAKFHTPEERDQYKDILDILFEPGPHSDM